jgi:two-component system, LytTR family, response regulator
MIKAMIVDDERMSRNTLRKLLEIYCPDVEVIIETDSAAEAQLQIELLQPQLVFLDIAMPGKSGIEMLKEMKEIKFEVIFVTAHDRFVLQAIRLSAVDYLSKPVDENELITAVTNAKKRIEEKTKNSLVPGFLYNMQQNSPHQEMQMCIPGMKGFQIIKIKDILYCEAQNTYTCVFLQNGQKLLASRPLIDYETMLAELSFLRIHKSYLINMQHLKEYIKGEGGFAVMSNGKELEVSRRKKEYFIAYMKEYLKY